MTITLHMLNQSIFDPHIVAFIASESSRKFTHAGGTKIW
jgi:hypothetical protein